jgi:hypothetical protein
MLRAMCLRMEWASSGVTIIVSRTRCSAGRGTNQEKNMRAAEAMVSSAPNPMKIFPIREV